MATAVIQSGIQIELQSISDDVYEVLYDTNNSGDLLEAIIDVDKFGGVKKFSFSIPRDKHIVISNNTRVLFYVDGVLWFNGYIKNVPLDDQTKPVRIIDGAGFINKLKDKVINETYTSETLADIIDDIGTTYFGSELDVFYDIANIDVPAIASITIQFNDKSLHDVFERLLSIANYDYANDKYIFYINTDNEIVVENLSTSLITHLFEDFQYQNPDVSEDVSRIINKILAYRTETADPDVVEYVATYQDTVSQGRYGLFEKKITFPDFIDTTTIANIAAFLLERFKEPQKIIGVDDLVVTAPLSFGEYRLSNRRERYWKIASEMDTILVADGWDFSNLSVTTVALSDIRVLTGRKSVEFTTADGSLGEYAEFTLPEKIPFPIAVNIFIYFVSLSTAVTFRLYDINDDYEEISLNILTVVMQVDHSGVEDLQVDNTGVEDLEVDFLTGTSFDSWTRLNHDVLNIVDITKIRISFDSNTAVVIYVDLIEAFADIFSPSDLQLENVNYRLSSLGLLANCSFGNRQRTIVDEILKRNDEALTALKVISKQ